MPEDIQSKEIRGINLKIVFAVLGVVGTLAFVYADLRSETRMNREILTEMREESAKYREKRDMELKVQEIQLRELSVRLQIIEKNLSK